VGNYDKGCYSPWGDGRLHVLLSDLRADTLIITGGETDVRVIGTALGALDLGTASSLSGMRSVADRTVRMTRHFVFTMNDLLPM
jgi:nicotinamidase-related amidase